MKAGGAALLLLNGELRDADVVARLARRADLVLCADGGARHAKSLGIVPDVIVGDMDSWTGPAPKAWADTVVLRDTDEKRSDLDKALDEAARLGAARVYVAGALGGALDHELVNLALLEGRVPGPEVVLVGGGWARLLGPGRYRLRLARGERFSLLAAPRARVTLTGARHRLLRSRLVRGSRGLGNLSLGRTVLAVDQGRVWLMFDASSAARASIP